MGKSEGIEIGFVPPTLQPTTIELGSRLYWHCCSIDYYYYYPPPHNFNEIYRFDLRTKKKKLKKLSSSSYSRGRWVYSAAVRVCRQTQIPTWLTWELGSVDWMRMSWEEARVGIVFIHSCSPWSGAFSCDNHVLECLVWVASWALSLSFVLFCNNNNNHHRSIRSVLFTRRDYHP